jgi:hypothetical protein
VLGAQAIQITDNTPRECLPTQSPVGVFSFLLTHQSQFACIEPIPATIGTFIDLDSALGAEEMAMKLNIGATRAFALARWIYDYSLIATNSEQGLTGSFILFIHLLQLVCIEPNATAAILTDVDDERSDLHLGEVIEASWTFHTKTLAQMTQVNIKKSGRHVQRQPQTLGQ